MNHVFIYTKLWTVPFNFVLFLEDNELASQKSMFLE